MDLYQIILPKDNDWEIMSELGQIGLNTNGSNHGSGSSCGGHQSNNMGSNNREENKLSNANVSLENSSSMQSYQYTKDQFTTKGVIQFIDLNN